MKADFEEYFSSFGPDNVVVKAGIDLSHLSYNLTLHGTP